MDRCHKCKRLVAGQTLALNKKFLGRSVKKFMCFDCLVEFVGTTREALFNRIHDFIEIEECPLFDVEKFDLSKSALKQAQMLTLEEKFKITCERITEWYYHFNGQVYVSFSGGKDSTVLLHIARMLFPDIEAVFVNTGLEYPEIQKFVKSFDNVTIIRPKMRFDEVIKEYGYPIIGKEVSQAIWYANQGSSWAINQLNGLDRRGNPHKFKESMYAKYKPLCDVDFKISNKCCLVMKESPLAEKGKVKKPIVAIMAAESKRRETAWLMTGCNAFSGEKPMSKPMSFWTEQDVLQYIKENNIPIATVYGDIVYSDTPEQMRMEEYGVEGVGTEKLVTTGCDRTGCIFCGFGCHLENSPSRFERLKQTHPRQYEYCIGGGEYATEGYCQNGSGEFTHFVFEHDDGTPYTPAEIENFIEENKDNPHFKFERKWQPNKKGLGLGHVFDELNKIYGDGFIKY